ncbi:hypothetical protein TNCV_1748951 [Trichonephila clavipes]|nr:hypothetical protein TNCV_1748951 [Trichonephila clavipes]
MVSNDAKMVAKNDANLALPPRFRQVLIASPLKLFTATVSEGKAIFGGRAAIEFSFGEKERPAQRRSN